MKNLLIIDTFGLIFRAYYALPPLTSSDGTPTGAIYGFLQMLLSVIQKHDPEYIVCSLESTTPTFRHEMNIDYKANRKETEPDLKVQIEIIIDLINQLNIKTLQKDGFEADDVIGTFANKNFDRFERIDILTGDRDLLQLVNQKIVVMMPGRPFNNITVFDEKIFEEKFCFSVDRYVLYKALIGDSSDNIKGIPGIGPKTATEIVKKFEDINSLLANLDDLPTRIALSIQENQSILRQSFELSQIRFDVDLDLEIEFCKLSTMRVHKLRDFMTKFEFRSLATKINKFIDWFESKYSSSLWQEATENYNLFYNITSDVKYENQDNF